MGKSIRSKKKRKFRAIKRVKNDDFETNRIKERYVKLQVRLGKSEEEVRQKLTEDMAEAKSQQTMDKLDVEEQRKAVHKQVKAQLASGDVAMDDSASAPDMGVDADHPLGKNSLSVRRNGPRGKGAKGLDRKPTGLKALLRLAGRGGPNKKLTTNRAMNRKRNPDRKRQ